MIVVPPAHQVTYDAASVLIFHANKGQGLPRHEHTYSHLTMCHSGSCVLRKEGKELVIDKYSQPVNLVGGEWHEIQALEDDTVFVNIFAEGK
jgi:quercetin dioxygenase-like cupin family protein